MTDLQARISGVVLNRLADYGIRIDREIADSVAEAVIAMSGTVTVELPEYNEEYGCFSGAGYPCNGDPEHLCGAPGGMVRAGLPTHMTPRVARAVAAALLASANAAEESPKSPPDRSWIEFEDRFGRPSNPPAAVQAQGKEEK